MKSVISTVRTALISCLSGVVLTLWGVQQNLVSFIDGRLLFLLILAIAAAITGFVVYCAHRQSSATD
ncbi:hypothetical protein [Alteromonas antoniana]|uniref:hypothetical protein n=1 Tax=Alteromonas antoniana TaxID=2803813 RepID=UPI001C475A84|nr:hypothetical protein [Alteromonas antoniana]